MAKNFTLTLNHFGGLHLNGAGEVPISDGESPKMKNFRITQTGQLKLREGYRVLQKKDGPVRCLWQGTLGDDSFFLALIGKWLYRSKDGFVTLCPIGEIEGEQNVCCLEFREKLYLLTGNTILCCDGEKLEEITPYRPLIRISSPPGGGGTPLEDVNFLTPQVRQSFSPDGTTQIFHLAERKVKSIDYVLHNGIALKENEDYVPDPSDATVQVFGKDGSEYPVEAGTDSLEIGYTLLEHSYAPPLCCRYGVTYGGENDTRAFLYGNPSAPAVRYYSGIADGLPTMSYFPVSNASMVGDGEEITSIIRHYDRQIIFTPHSTYYSYPETQTEQTGRQYTSFPVYTLSALRGNTVEGPGLLVDNKPLSVMPSGLYLWNSTSVRDERNAVCISSRISPALAQENLRNARVFLRSMTEEVYVVVSTGIYVYNYRKNLFYYYEGFRPRVTLEDETSAFFFGTDDGKICRTEGVLDDGEGIEAYWESGPLFCGDRTHKKHLFDASFGLSSTEPAPLLLSWVTDNATSRTLLFNREKRLFANLFSFENLDFESLSFETARRSKRRKIRIGAKRFDHITLCLTHPKEPHDLCLTHLILRGKICDQKS